MTFGKSRTVHLPSMDSVTNPREYAPMVSPCGSMDQLLHLSTEEQAMDVESINTSGEINESLLFLDEVDIEEESSDCYTSHGSTKSKDGGAENSLKDEKRAEVSGVSIKEEKYSTTPERIAQDSTKGTWIAAKIKKEPDAENGKDCSPKSLDCSNSHDIIMVNFEDEVARETKVEPILENNSSAESPRISTVENGVEEEERTEKTVDAVAVKRLAGNGGDSANTNLGGQVSAAAVDAANSGAAVSVPDDSNLIVLTRQQLELYVTLRMRQCLVAEHIAQRQPFEKKYCALQRSLVRWRCRALQLQQQLQDLISADNEQAGLQRRPQQRRSVGMLVRLPSPERQQPPLSPPPTPEPPVVTSAAPSVTMATQWASAPPPVTMATPASMLPHPSSHFEPAVPTIVARGTLPAILRLPTPRLRATASNTVQGATTAPAHMLVRLPPAKQPFSSTMATPRVPTSAVPVSMATPPVPTVAVPVNMATPSVFMPSVPGSMGAPLVFMAVPSGAMGQLASPHFLNPTVVAADGSRDSPTHRPPMNMLCVPQQMVAAANASMLTAEGAVGMLVQLPCANLQQPSFGPIMAGPPVAPVVAGPPVAMATQPVAMAIPPVAMTRSVSGARSASPHFSQSMAVRPSFGASQTSSLMPTQQTVVATANASTLTMTNASSSTSKSEAIHVIIDTTNGGTPLPDETGCVGKVVRLAPSELQKLASASSVADPSVPMATAPVAMATADSPHAPPRPSCHSSGTATDTGSSSELLRKLLLKEADSTPFGSTTLPGGVSVKPVPAPSCATTQTASLSSTDFIDLTLEEDAENTPVKVIPGTGTGISLTTSGTKQLSVPFSPALKMALTSHTQVPTLSSELAPATRASIPSPSELSSPNAVWHSEGEVAQPGLPLPARVKYYMPKCMVVTPPVPGMQPAASGALQQPAPPILVPVGSPAVMTRGGLASACPPGSPSEPPAIDSTAAAAKETWPGPQVPDDASFPLPSISSRLVTDVTWSGSTQYTSAGAIVQNCSLPSPPASTNSLSNVAPPCFPTLVEVGEVDASVFVEAKASVCEAERPKRTAADRMRDCRLRKKLATASPVKKVPKSGAQRIREFRERLKAKSTADNGSVDQQVQENELSSESDHEDVELNNKAEEDDLDLILICDSESCPSSPAGEENNDELLLSDGASS